MSYTFVWNTQCTVVLGFVTISGSSNDVPALIVIAVVFSFMILFLFLRITPSPSFSLI